MDIGEKIINVIEKILIKNSPNGPYVARWNADEFVCVIPDYEDSQALGVARKLVSKINKYNWNQLYLNLFLTISCGVSVYRRRGIQKEVEWIETAILGSRSIKSKRRRGCPDRGELKIITFRNSGKSESTS